jgi:hypothetical protein
MGFSEFLFLGLEAIGFIVLILIIAICCEIMERLKSN